ncbi:hypothetical protein ACTXT7_012087 [Hymenolepis weldensis]
MPMSIDFTSPSPQANVILKAVYPNSKLKHASVSPQISKETSFPGTSKEEKQWKTSSVPVKNV